MRTLLFILVLFFPVPLLASNGTIVFVTTEGASEEAAYWWSDTESQFTSFDTVLSESSRAEGLELVEPVKTEKVSRIYRTPELSDANAATLAGILGARWALIGKLFYTKTPAPGFKVRAGVTLRLEAKLLERRDDGTFRIADRIDLRHTQFADELSTATDLAETELARMTVGWVELRLRQPVVSADGPPLSGDWLLLHDLEDGRTLEAVLRALRDADSVSEARIGWTDGNVVALELTGASGPLSPAAIRAAAASLSPDERGFSLEPTPSREDSLVEFEVQVLTEAQ